MRGRRQYLFIFSFGDILYHLNANVFLKRAVLDFVFFLNKNLDNNIRNTK